MNFTDPTGLYRMCFYHFESRSGWDGNTYYINRETLVFEGCIDFGNGYQQSRGGGRGGRGSIDGGQGGGEQERGPACGGFVIPAANAAKTAAPLAAAESAGAATLLGTVLGVIGLLVALETTAGGPRDTPDPPTPLTVYRHADKISPSTFRIDPPNPPGNVSTFEHKDPARTYNIPFHGYYYGPRVPGRIAGIVGVTEVSVLLKAKYTPEEGGEGHWSLLKPHGMSDEMFKKGLSDYAKRVIKGNCP